MQKVIQLKLSQVQPNPSRDAERFTLDEEKVSQLRKSIAETGLWTNILIREVDGEYQQAYGHHRLEAAKQELGSDAVCNFILVDFGDLFMLRVMSHENSLLYGQHPNHAFECILGARKHLLEAMSRHSTLALDSKAKTRNGQRRAERKRASDGITTPPDAQTDIEILQDVFSDEGNYQKAKQANEVGRVVLEKFLDGAIGRKLIEQYLRQIQGLQRAKDNVAAQNAIIRSTKAIKEHADSHAQGAAILSVHNRMEQVLEDSNITMDEHAKDDLMESAIKSGKNRGSGRSINAKELERTAITYIAKELKSEGAPDEVVQNVYGEAFELSLKRLKQDGRQIIPTNWRRMINAAKESGVTYIRKIDIFGGVVAPLVEAVKVTNEYIEFFGVESLRDKERDVLLTEAHALIKVLEGVKDNAINN